MTQDEMTAVDVTVEEEPTTEVNDIKAEGKCDDKPKPKKCLADIVCRHFLAGHCSKAKNCRFQHPIDHPDLDKLDKEVKEHAQNTAYLWAMRTKANAELAEGTCKANPEEKLSKCEKIDKKENAKKEKTNKASKGNGKAQDGKATKGNGKAGHFKGPQHIEKGGGKSVREFFKLFDKGDAKLSVFPKGAGKGGKNVKETNVKGSGKNAKAGKGKKDVEEEWDPNADGYYAYDSFYGGNNTDWSNTADSFAGLGPMYMEQYHLNMMQAANVMMYMNNMAMGGPMGYGGMGEAIGNGWNGTGAFGGANGDYRSNYGASNAMLNQYGYDMFDVSGGMFQ